MKGPEGFPKRAARGWGRSRISVAVEAEMNSTIVGGRMKRELMVTMAATLMVGLLVFAVGCGGTRPKPTAEEQGRAAQPAEAEQAKRQAEEDEVLRLLGIVGTEKSEAKPAPQAPAPTPQETKTEELPPAAVPPQQIETQISQLEQQLGARETEAEALKSELAEKERKLGQLQSQTQQHPSMPEAAKPRAARQAKVSATGSYKERYQEALMVYENRHYKDAIRAFEALLAENSTNPLADNCQYWIGECYYGLGNYSQAIIEFEKVFSFSSANKSDAAQLKLGLCYLKLGDKVRAREEFQRLLESYPKSEYVPKAKAYLSQL